MSAEQSGFRRVGAASLEGATAAAVSRFWTGPDAPRVEDPGRAVVIAMIELAHQLNGRLLRLQALEARLADLVRRRRRFRGRSAVRQIELERLRLSRELHTGVGQSLAAIGVQVELIHRYLPNPSADVGQCLRHVRVLAEEALDDVRSISRCLHPPKWQGLSIDAALIELWEISGVAQRFAGDIRMQPPARDPDPEMKTLLYRAAQEELANIFRHSRAKRVDLRLDNPKDRLILTVHDDGIGFETDIVFSGRSGLDSGIGLRAIREETLWLGGKLRVDSGPRGTTLEVSVPLLD